MRSALAGQREARICIRPLRLFVDLDLHAMIEGGGDLVDMVEVGRQQGVEVDALAAGDRHARRPVAEMAADADRLRDGCIGSA